MRVMAFGLLVAGSGLVLYAIALCTGDCEDLGRVSAGTLARIRAAEGGDLKDFDR